MTDENIDQGTQADAVVKVTVTEKDGFITETTEVTKPSPDYKADLLAQLDDFNSQLAVNDEQQAALTDTRNGILQQIKDTETLLGQIK